MVSTVTLSTGQENWGSKTRQAWDPARQQIDGKATNIIQGGQNFKMAPNESYSCLLLCPGNLVWHASIDYIMLYGKSEHFADVIKANQLIWS